MNNTSIYLEHIKSANLTVDADRSQDGGLNILLYCMVVVVICIPCILLPCVYHCKSNYTTSQLAEMRKRTQADIVRIRNGRDLVTKLRNGGESISLNKRS